MKFLIRLTFVGTNYSGFQVQKNDKTVQGVLQSAAENILGVECKLSGCSRTDARVHAYEYFATVEFSREKPFPPEAFPKAINTVLPDDIRVLESREVDDGFILRRHIVKKEYVYKICLSEYRDPFFVDRVMFYHKEIDVDLINSALEKICGTHDFAAFCASGTAVIDTVRTIYSAYAEKRGNIVEFHITGDGFLYNMVRIIVGTALYVNEGKIKVSKIEDIIKSKDRSRAGVTAKPDGLYLNKVYIEE